jgi:hypothetical protein
MNIHISERGEFPYVQVIGKSKQVRPGQDVRVFIGAKNSQYIRLGETVKEMTSGIYGKIVVVNGSHPAELQIIIRPLKRHESFSSAGSEYLTDGALLEITSVDVLTQKEYMDRLSYEASNSSNTNRSSNDDNRSSHRYDHDPNDYKRNDDYTIDFNQHLND